jgi:hypothetical protein
LISERLQVKAPRAAAWKHFASAVTGVAPAAVSDLKAGDRVRVGFDGGPTANGVVQLVVPGSALAILLPDLTDAVLFIELEGSAPESFHTGWWLSVYDTDRAQEIEAPAKRTFTRIHESIPA